jgi:DNA polymerase-3 subunit alpha (Gram-positive type)
LSKPFPEVFPTLKLSDEMSGLMSHCEVTSVRYNRDKTQIRIHLTAERLIAKQDIYDLAKTIGDQLFPDHSLSVAIVENFRLSEQYDLEYLVGHYRDSILTELKQTDLISYHILNHAVWQVQDGEIVITVPDGAVARSRAARLGGWISGLFENRLAVKARTVFRYSEPDTEKKRERRMAEEQHEVEKILRNAERSAELLPAAGDEAAKASGSSRRGPAGAGAQTGNYSNGGKTAAGGFSGGRAFQPSSGKTRRRGRRFEGPDGKKVLVRGKNPGLIYGRDFSYTELTPISDIQEEMGDVVIKGVILSIDERPLRRGGATICSMAVTDYQDTIMVKMFIDDEVIEEFRKNFTAGQCVIVNGRTVLDTYDHEIGISSVIGIQKGTWDAGETRDDLEPVKRVELHCHTKASEMDAVTDVDVLVKRAHQWGHRAMAVTDHGCVYAFPEAAHALDKDPAQGKDFKVLYGCEGYLVDDEKHIVTNCQDSSWPLRGKFVVFDLETTGLNSRNDRIIEIGAVKVEEGRITDRFSEFVNPERPIPYKIEHLTSISDDTVKDAPTIDVILPKFLQFCEGCVLVAHNADFDTGFVAANMERLGLGHFDTAYVDTVGLARYLLPHLHRFRLDTVAKELDVSLENHHRAVDDAGATADIFVRMIEMLAKRGITTLGDLQEKAVLSTEAIMHMKTYHIILIAANEVGRVNLYRLVSLAHVKYFSRTARFPRSEIEKYREGILIGSACEAGELIQAIEDQASDDELVRIAGFYDYLEIQPTMNNQFLLRKEDSGYKTVEDLQGISRKIVELGELTNKPVCATCDVHFIDPQDEIYRRIIMAGKGFEDADMQPPLYFRTTREMLDEFAFLGSEKAYEVVVTNTNLIADMCDTIQPTRPDKCPPVIENSEQDLRDMCFKKAHEMYGDPLPQIVQERLDKELHSIIGNGYSVMYLIAQKLVNKSNADGYLVGSRGSVGSSLAATMAGITEVNPLPPHYYCPKCHYSDFDSPEVMKYRGMAGCDMPDRKCPKCGTKLVKDGFDIPFETFLGFYGDKEPDIDLNFSGEYQSKAHAYTEVIFGAGQTFRAGTVGTLADKTAWVYVKKYFEERGVQKRGCEISRLAQGCTGVKRSSGQHPGGIIVLPNGEDINTFTPVQHPADDMSTPTITTHFDYHKIDKNLLKLDILGHDDPTMIRMLQDLIGVDPRTFPLDSPEVMSLFESTEALGITPEQIGGTKLGVLGLPEFGTDFAMQMVLDAKPKHFSDLIRISGLAHGTDVWQGNAETLIKEGKATISTAICTRDDIMTFLISKGMDKGLSFRIMESVRKGRGLKPEWEEEMNKHDLPDWYIWSCKKIKYMFPRAHAAAYDMMMWRIAYAKVFYPLQFYAAWFSIRATGFSYELMCRGPEELERNMADYKARMDTLSDKEKDTYHDMRLVQEMYARGFEFVPIEIDRVQANRFQVIDGKLMPSLSSIEGIGANQAEAIVDARKDGPFLSRQDFRERAGVGTAISDKLNELGILSDIPETNQLSIYDFLGTDAAESL